MTQSTCTCAQNILRLMAFSFVSSNLDQYAVENALRKTASTRVIEVLVIAGIVGVQRTHIRRVPCLEAKRREKFHCFCGRESVNIIEHQFLKDISIIYRCPTCLARRKSYAP